METLINKQQLIEVLGGGISKRTVDEWIYLKKIPYVKVGGLVRFRPSHIEKWLNKNTHEPKILELI
jgi:excisionase family DNA binding protein